jgi:hypothetical protein
VIGCYGHFFVLQGRFDKLYFIVSGLLSWRELHLLKKIKIISGDLQEGMIFVGGAQP